MSLDPKTREGRGRFVDGPQVKLDDDVLDATIAEAGVRTIVYDIFHLLVFGFLSALKGLVVIKSGIGPDGDRREKDT